MCRRFVSRSLVILSENTYDTYRQRYQKCIRMLNSLERLFEKQPPISEHRWPDTI